MSTLTPRSQSCHKVWLLWLLLFTIVGAMILGGSNRTVLQAYDQGSERWLRSQPLYNSDTMGFNYLPISAVTYLPFTFLPPLGAALLWRLLSLAIYAFGFWKLAKLTDNTNESSLRLASIVTLPLCWGALLNGQATTAMTGFVMCAFAEAADRRWWRTTLYIGLALLFKPLALIPLCLLAVLHRPLWSRAPLAVVAVLCLPMLTQSPRYVWQQTLAWVEMMRTANAVGMVPQWAHLLSALEIFGVRFTPTTQLCLRVGAGVGVLGICVSLPRFRDRADALFLTFTLGMAYLMLFSPRTEGNTYVALAPSLGLLIATLVRRNEARICRAVWIGCAIAIFGNYELSKLLAPDRPHVWLAPFAAAVFAITLLLFSYRDESVLRSA